MVKINEPQLPWLRTAIYHTGLDVKMEVTQCAGHISANTRHHQLCWGDREWACTCTTYMYIICSPALLSKIIVYTRANNRHTDVSVISALHSIDQSGHQVWTGQLKNRPDGFETGRQF